MKITAVTATPIALPLVQPFRYRSGVQEGVNLVLFAVETDEGVTGYGESICEDPAAVISYGELIARAFVGRSPGDIEAIFGDLWRNGRWRVVPHFSLQILSGIESACWDALGKGLGVPASTFLGGRVHDEVDFMAFPQGDTAEELAGEAAAFAAEGYRVVYIKVGRGQRDDAEIVGAVRDAIGPEPLLRIDPNEAWDVPGAVDAIRRLEAFDLDWVEQPVAAGNVAGLARVRNSVETKIAADQAVHTTAELRAVLDEEAADAIVLGSHESGGLWRWRQMAYLAESYGIPMNRHACPESAISTFAALQVMALHPEPDRRQPGHAPPDHRAAHDDPDRDRRRSLRRADETGPRLRDRPGRGRAGARALRAARPVLMDPITFEVIRNALVAATDEMVLTLRRSAYSTNIKTRSDFSCAFFDAELRAVAQGFTQPVHLGSMVEQVPRAILDYGPENLEPGDVIITNEPFPSGVHLNDISLISPVHHDGELLGYVANLAHHVDVGGGAPASIGAFREVFQEGVIIPPVKVVAAGQIVRDVFDLILAQIRSKHETGGDFRAQIAANATGVRRLQALVGRHGLETVTGTMRELLDYTERRTRAEIAALPHGVYEAEGTVDVDGYTDEPVRLQARIEITADGVAFDLTGSDPQRRAPVNSTYAQTFSACAYAVKCLIDPDLPVNDGFYRVVSLDAPKGTVTNCTWPSPVVGGWETQTRLVDVIFRALLPALPERLPAGTKAMMCHAGFGGVDRETNEYYCFLETFGGGYGGRFASDGPDAVQTHGQNTENAPVEETELNYPVRVARLSLVEDSEGPGRFRGGLGLRKDFVFDRATTFTVLADRTLAGPAGAFGGRAGKPAEYVLIRGGVETRLGAKTTIEVEAGDTVSYRTCGGGGYGPPEERDRELVARDVREGKVSAERAREEYAMAAVDPISFEVIRNALVAATDEMALALKRSAYSTNIKTRSDFSCAFFDAQLRSVAQGFAQPVHLGSMAEQVPKAVAPTAPRTSPPATYSSRTTRTRAAST